MCQSSRAKSYLLIAMPILRPAVRNGLGSINNYKPVTIDESLQDGEYGGESLWRGLKRARGVGFGGAGEALKFEALKSITACAPKYVSTSSMYQYY